MIGDGTIPVIIASAGSVGSTALLNMCNEHPPLKPIHMHPPESIAKRWETMELGYMFVPLRKPRDRLLSLYFQFMCNRTRCIDFRDERLRIRNHYLGNEEQVRKISAAGLYHRFAGAYLEYNGENLNEWLTALLGHLGIRTIDVLMEEDVGPLIVYKHHAGKHIVFYDVDAVPHALMLSALGFDGARERRDNKTADKWYCDVKPAVEQMCRRDALVCCESLHPLLRAVLMF